MDNPERSVEAIWRIESGRIIAVIARMVRDVSLAQDLAQEALLAALEHWPQGGVPDNPGAWLMAVAKNKALDQLRQQALHLRKQEELGADAYARGEHVQPDFVDALDAELTDDIGDDLLRLIFTACHPVLSREAQTALTLRLLGGLSTSEIARADVVPEPTIAQRIVRAKTTLTEKRVPFELPRGEERGRRLSVVLEVLYLIFNEGYSASSGPQWMRPTLCEEALRLARTLAQLAPHEAEAHGLQALLEIQASRLRARVDAEGRPILLMDQDRTRWDRLLIHRGLAALQQSRLQGGRPGPYELQARIAACHATAATPEATDWQAIAALYDELLAQVPSPVVELNRAVAIGMAYGPEAALPLVEKLQLELPMQRYGLLHAVRGDLLSRLNRRVEARHAFEKAAELATNEQDKALMQRRAAELAGSLSSCLCPPPCGSRLMRAPAVRPR
jgi:RNA polymerase sigma factor (sigma-70 family)